MLVGTTRLKWLKGKKSVYYIKKGASSKSDPPMDMHCSLQVCFGPRTPLFVPLARAPHRQVGCPGLVQRIERNVLWKIIDTPLSIRWCHSEIGTGMQLVNDGQYFPCDVPAALHVYVFALHELLQSGWSRQWCWFQDIFRRAIDQFFWALYIIWMCLAAFRVVDAPVRLQFPKVRYYYTTCCSINRITDVVNSC